MPYCGYTLRVSQPFKIYSGTEYIVKRDIFQEVVLAEPKIYSCTSCGFETMSRVNKMALIS